jgi:hypothetical protein
MAWREESPKGGNNDCDTINRDSPGGDAHSA